MTCCDELTLMMYSDGELDEGRRREVVVHVGQCGRCASLLAALEIEARVVAMALRGEDATAVVGIDLQPRRDHLPPVGRVAAAGALVALVTAALRFLVESAGLSPLAALPDWMNPFRDEGRSNLFFNAAVYLVREGEAIMSSVITFAGLSATAVLVLSFISTAAKHVHVRGRSGVACMVLLGMLLGVGTADALEVRRSEGSLTIPSGETVDDTLIALAETVQVDGNVTGDLIALGRRVRVRGMVRGNLITAARDVEIDGAVEGSILQFGQTLVTRGQTSGNLYAFGQTITVPSGARVGGNATTFSETTTIEGAVGHDVTSFGRELDLGGMVSRRVNAYGERVDIRAGARIDGGLTAHVPDRENVRVDPGATIGGVTRIEVSERAPSRFVTVRYYVRQVIRLAAAFLTGWIFFRLVPGAAAIRLDSGGALLTALGAGAIAACATPILAIVIGITIVGLPLAVFALVLWAILLYLAKILLAVSVGRAIVGSSGAGIAGALMVGLVLIIVAVNVPYVGGLVNVLLTVTGLGAAVIEGTRWYRGSGSVPAGV